MTSQTKTEKTSILDLEGAREEITSRDGKAIADVVEEEPTKQKRWTNLCLRITTNMVKHIDQLLEDRIGISRTGWILEAVQEKLRRDNNQIN